VPDALWREIERAIAHATHSDFRIESRSRASGGCINAGWTLAGRGRRYYVKVNEPTRLCMFEAEAAGLAELARAGALRVPVPLAWGASSASSWIVLEYLVLAPREARTDAALGCALAQLHRHTRAAYGWERDNTLGSTPQPNPSVGEWPSFWREHRLGHQLALARDRGGNAKLLERGWALLEQVPGFFPGYSPAASLLHGDLWSGNAARGERGVPVVFDPAVYYGDRETDIAMTELFGGFSASFYAAYRDAFAVDPGYAVRKDLYNLYHVLNHAHLFGGSYVHEAARMIDALLAQVR
jgi:protein-ribulosamine 3-kinase